MQRRRPRWLRLSRWIAAGLCAGGLGCHNLDYVADYPVPGPGVARKEGLIRPGGTRALPEGPAYFDGHVPKPDSAPPPVQPASHTEPAPAAPAAAKEIPITLDAVLRLAEQYNPRVALAREKLRESHLTLEQGSTGWIPNVYAGVGYYRHEGGIQGFDGRLIHSSFGALFPTLNITSELDLRESVFQLLDLERRIWQNKAELSQVNNEVLLEAGQTYVDLLTAERGVALSQEIEKYERKLLDRAERAAKADRGAVGLVESIKATLSNRHQLESRLRLNARSASAKLVYLLGLPPGTCLKPIDVLAPVELVDTTPPPCDLIARSYTSGPAVREMEGIIDTVSQALERTYGHNNLLPAIQANLCEGPFGAGPGGSLAWDNRFDLGLQLKWNVTQLCQIESRRNLIRSKQAQAMYSLDEVKNKLALGVTDSRDTILAGREQIGLATSQIRHADESYKVSERRMEAGLEGGKVPSEVLLAIRNVEQAHFNHLQAIQSHNKAQVRLLMLLGGGPAEAVPVAKGPPTPLPALPEPRPADRGAAGEKLPELPRPKND
jgi:outer membrane protein TolC